MKKIAGTVLSAAILAATSPAFAQMAVPDQVEGAPAASSLKGSIATTEGVQVDPGTGFAGQAVEGSTESEMSSQVRGPDITPIGADAEPGDVGYVGTPGTGTAEADPISTDLDSDVGFTGATGSDEPGFTGDADIGSDTNAGFTGDASAAGNDTGAGFTGSGDSAAE